MSHRKFPQHGQWHATAVLTLAAVLAAGCGGPAADDGSGSTEDPAVQARHLAAASIIVDSHVDVPFKLLKKPTDVSVSADGFNFDYPRAVAGGLNAPFMSIFTEAELEAEGKSREVADKLIDLVEGMVASAPDKFAIARSPQDVRLQFDEGLISLAMGMENGSPIEDDLANLKHFYDRGIRYITLAHSKSNLISDSSYDENKRWHGLSDFGVQVVAEMNRLGIMVDVSHISDEAFWDVMDVSAVPVIASHSSARHFTPGFERNMSDDMIRRLAENGGVIQLNFGSGFLTAKANEYDKSFWPAGAAYEKAHPDMDQGQLDEAFMHEYQAEHGPYPYADIDDLLDTIDYVVGLVGIDHVGLGSDFDGVGDTLPVGLKDVSCYPNLIEGLLRRGYDEADIRKILGGNLLRVWEAVENYAATQAASTSSST
jgi:membrane dipeptidase